MLLFFQCFSITLILVSHDEENNDWLFGQLLDLIFGAIVLFLGIEDIVSMKNVERTKNDIRVILNFFTSLVYMCLGFCENCCQIT